MPDGAGGGGDVLLAAGVVACAPRAPGEAVGAPARGRLTVVVEDVARADAAAPVLGRAALDVDLGGGRTAAFVVRGAPPPAGARPAVRAHLAVDGSGQVRAGDWVTTEHVPAARGVRLVLHPVGGG